MPAPVVTTWKSPRTRADILLEAIKSELLVRRSMVNGAADVRAVTITVKMKGTSLSPRAVLVMMETETTLDEPSS